jgi:hypothetical protein
MLKKETINLMNLFGVSTILEEPKKIINKLSPEEKAKRKEKSDAHRAWKLYKSIKFDENLTEEHKILLLKYYGVKL